MDKQEAVRTAEAMVCRCIADMVGRQLRHPWHLTIADQTLSDLIWSVNVSTHDGLDSQAYYADGMVANGSEGLIIGAFTITRGIDMAAYTTEKRGDLVEVTFSSYLTATLALRQ